MLVDRKGVAAAAALVVMVSGVCLAEDTLDRFIKLVQQETGSTRIECPYALSAQTRLEPGIEIVCLNYSKSHESFRGKLDRAFERSGDALPNSRTLVSWQDGMGFHQRSYFVDGAQATVTFNDPSVKGVHLVWVMYKRGIAVPAVVPSTPVTAPPQTTEGARCTSSLIRDETDVSSARRVAETYWNSLKNADAEGMRSVSAHQLMTVVFDWSFVNETPISIEEGAIPPIRENLRKAIALQLDAHRLPLGPHPDRLPLLEASATHAKAIETVCPVLGEFLQHGNWETITPADLVDRDRFALMRYDYLVNAEMQSRAGTTLKKRVTTKLFRLKSGAHDSGWKVFFTVD